MSLGLPGELLPLCFLIVRAVDRDPLVCNNFSQASPALPRSKALAQVPPAARVSPGGRRVSPSLAAGQLHPLVSPHVSHFAHAPLRTSVSD